MPSVCLYFKVHQPYPLREYAINGKQETAQTTDGAEVPFINRVADECYLPANDLILRLVNESNGRFKVCYAISGVVVSLLQRHRADVIDSFKTLVNTGCVELLGETYYHSLCYLHSQKEFTRQVEKHRLLLQEVFGVVPKVFVNTALIYNNHLPAILKKSGFEAALCEGDCSVSNGRNINRLYNSCGDENFKLLLRHSTLSDDIAFRFGDKQWNEYPLDAKKFSSWIHKHDDTSEVINLFMDYETFGLCKAKESGIFDFLEALPGEILGNPSFKFITASEALHLHEAKEVYDVPHTISWHNKTPDNCIWSENILQNNAIKKIYRLENLVIAADSESALDTWGKLQSADYFYHMKNESFDVNNPQSQNCNSPLQLCQTYLGTVASFEMALLQRVMDSKSRQEYNSCVTLY